MARNPSCSDLKTTNHVRSWWKMNCTSLPRLSVFRGTLGICTGWVELITSIGSHCSWPSDFVNQQDHLVFMPGNLARGSLVHMHLMILWLALTCGVWVLARARPPSNLDLHYKKDIVSNPFWWEARMNISPVEKYVTTKEELRERPHNNTSML